MTHNHIKHISVSPSTHGHIPYRPEFTVLLSRMALTHECRTVAGTTAGGKGKRPVTSEDVPEDCMKKGLVIELKKKKNVQGR